MRCDGIIDITALDLSDPDINIAVEVSQASNCFKDFDLFAR